MSDEINQQRRTLLGGALAAGTVMTGTSALAAKPEHRGSPAPAIDVHTHMYTRGWQEAVRKANDPHIKLTPGPNGTDSMFYMWSSVGSLGNDMFDWGLRLKKMDEARVEAASYPRHATTLSANIRRR